MNANEVIAALASRRLGRAVHPTIRSTWARAATTAIPTAIHVSAALALREQAGAGARASARRARASASTKLAGIVKTGRTHLMDAMPVTLGQELSGWRTQIEQRHGAPAGRRAAAAARWRRAAPRSVPASTRTRSSARRFCAELRAITGVAFVPARNYFEAMSAQDTAVELSGQLKVIAVSLMKIANDLRWMNSGPLAGLGEIALPALQPGSSIMPGKVNPVIPEAAAMVAAQVIGNDATITIAGPVGQLPAERDAAADRLQPAQSIEPARAMRRARSPIAPSPVSP